MNSCRICGSDNVEDAAFCSNCGMRLADNAPPPVDYPDPVPGQDYHPQGPSPAVAALRRFASSRLFLIAAAALTVSILLSIFSAMMPPAETTPDWLDDYITDSGLDISFREAVETGSGPLSAVLSQIMSIILCAALWMIRSACRGEGSRVADNGFAVLKTLSVIWIVLCSLALAGVLLFTAIITIGATPGTLEGMFVAPGDWSMSSFLTLLFLILLIAVAAVLIPLLIYFVKLLKTVNAMRYTALTGVPNPKISGYVIVLSFIAAGFAAVSAVTLIFIGSLYTLLTAFAALAEAVFIFSIALILRRYKKAMRQCLAEHNP